MSTGKVTGIFVVLTAGAPMENRDEVLAISGFGLSGDRYTNGKGSWNKKSGPGNRQVTLMNTKFFEGKNFTPQESRRNIMVSGTELMCLIGQKFKIGAAIFRGIEYCDPCVRPAKLANKSSPSLFKEEFEDCGGLIAEIVEGGLIKIGDLVIPPPKGY